jgi:hypothetical protein
MIRTYSGSEGVGVCSRVWPRNRLAREYITFTKVRSTSRVVSVAS